jgi:hypothetical protein
MIKFKLREKFNEIEPIRIEFGNKDLYNIKSLAFLSGLALKQIPELLNSIVKENSKSGLGITRENLFIKGPYFDSDGPLIIDKNQIYLFSYDGGEIVEFNKYLGIVLNYAHKALEAVVWYDLLEKGVVDEMWVSDVKQWITENEDAILKIQEDESE